MKKILYSTRAAYQTLGENLVLIILILAGIATLLVASPVHAMGTATCSIQQSDGVIVPCKYTVVDTTTNTSGVCRKSIEAKAPEHGCPVTDPWQSVENALNQQLKGAP